MIPKIIHYCWFGGKPIPENDAAYIVGWKRILPEYQFMFWNETTFDVNTVRFTKQVASVKKWGFIVDYIRAYVVYTYGGIYLDTDVELLRPLDNLLIDNICFSGFENKRNINPGSIFAGEKRCAIAKEVMDFYAAYSFIQENGELNLTDSPQIFTKILLKYGLKQNNTYQELGIFTAYPAEYFCPKSYRTGKTQITSKTYSIHHFDASWLSYTDKKYLEMQYKLYSLLGDNILVKALIRLLYVFKRIKQEGIKNALLYYIQKIAFCSASRKNY
jgi:mannosyltransferase OCH1-like enzyme